MNGYTNDSPARPVDEAGNGSTEPTADSDDTYVEGALPVTNGMPDGRNGDAEAGERVAVAEPDDGATDPNAGVASADTVETDGEAHETVSGMEAVGGTETAELPEVAVESEPPESPELTFEPDADAAEPWASVDDVPAAEDRLAEEPDIEEPAAAISALEEPVAAAADAQEPVPASTPPAPATVARYLAAALHGAGVKFAFTVPGESFLPLLDALPETGIKVVATRHEAGAAFMAEAYGQLTGRPAAVLVTRAVGAANASIGIHTARQNSTPMFVVVGQVTREVRGREAFQEADIVDSFGRLAKWAVEVDRAAALAPAVEEGVRRALSGRPGPVIFSIPEDVFGEQTADSVSPVTRRVGAAAPDPSAVRNVLRMLTDARRPLILAGGGVLRARATSDLVKLAEILEIPVVAAWRRQDVFPNDHRLYLGVTGYGAAETVRDRLADADAILVIGCRLNEVASFDYAFPGPGQRWAHVDLEPRRASAGLPEPAIAITADARAFLRAARERLAGAVHVAATLDERRAANEADRAAFEAASAVDTSTWDGPGVHPGHVIATLSDVLPPDAIVTTDAGNFSGWAARGYRFRRPGTFLGPTSGAMGYGLPAAISAALVHRDRPVVAVTGDGGFAMTMSELETAVRERSRVIALVFDNERYGMIRTHQDRRPEGRAVATDLGPIDFAAIARAAGANGILVEDDLSFEAALREALGADRPTVLHLRLDRGWGPVSEGRVSETVDA